MKELAKSPVFSFHKKEALNLLLPFHVVIIARENELLVYHLSILTVKERWYHIYAIKNCMILSMKQLLCKMHPF